MLDTVLNFTPSYEEPVLNFGENTLTGDVLIYQSDISIEFDQFESIYFTFNKHFITDKQEIKSVRLVLYNKLSGTVVKRFYGSSMKSGQSEKYFFEAKFIDYSKGLTTQQFLNKYSVKLEFYITDADVTGVADIPSLISDFNLYLKRDK